MEVIGQLDESQLKIVGHFAEFLAGIGGRKMIESPKSLTAVVHVKFHYEEKESKSDTESETESGVETLSKLLDQASELDPEYQELLIKFANHLKETRDKSE